MKKLFFFAVFLGTVIFIGVFVYSYLKLRTHTPQAYFESGKAFYDRGKYSEAAGEFLNAIKRDGNHRDSRYYLALSYLNQQDSAGGARELKYLLEIEPDDTAANLKLGSLYLEGASTVPELYHQAHEAAQRVLLKDPQNVPALLLSGNALAGMRELAASLESLQKAVSLEPKNASAWISLGSAWALQKNFPEAERAFLIAREVDPKGKSTLVSLANYYRIAGNPEKAKAVFDEALIQYPADSSVFSPAVDFYIGQKRSDEAERVLRAAQASNASDPAATLAMAALYRIQNRGEDARKLLLDAKSKFPHSIPLAIDLATDLMTDRPDQARLEIEAILKAQPNNPAGYVLLGELQFASGQLDASAKTLSKEPALGSHFPQVHYLLGNIAFQKGKFDEAQDHYQQSIKLEKSFIPARVALASVLMAQGNLPDARSAVRQLMEVDPENLYGRLMKATLDARDTTSTEAEAEFSSLVKEFPDKPEVLREMGLYFSSRGRNEEAEKSFLQALALAPNEQSFGDLTVFYLQTNQTERARQKLNGIPDAQKQAYHYELIGMTAEQSGRSKDSEIAYKKALEKDLKRLSAETRLFNQYLRTGHLDEALKQLNRLEREIPANGIVSAMKAAIEEYQGKFKEAEENYRKALQADPTINLAANNLAYLLAQEGRDLQTAMKLAQAVRERQPQDATAADTLGWVLYKLDLPVLARVHAQFAVSIHPENGVFQYHLGEIYKRNSQVAEAEAALKKAVSNGEAFKEKDLAKAELQVLLKEKAPLRQ